MESYEGLPVLPLECVADVSERSWALVGLGQIDGGDCYIADITDEGRVRVAGYFEAATGDVLECVSPLAVSACGSAGSATAFADEPAVHAIGSPEGDSGQLTVRQDRGNYLRICRWDRLQPSIRNSVGAEFRTLPQCGCGGSLGAPKLFDTFAEMSAYHFCAFFV